MGEVVIRRGGRLEDLDGMVAVEIEAWPEEQAFTKEHFQSHLSVFPEGIFIAEVDGEIAGVGISEIIKYNKDEPIPTWYEVSDYGYLRKSHDPAGNVLYGVSLSVSPKFGHHKLGEKMLTKAQLFVVERALEYFVIGSRVPRYHKWSSKMGIEEYIKYKKRNRYLDPEIEFYSRCGFEPVRVLPHYFEDPDSLDYGVLMVWANPNLQRPS